jgi:hypothetical protein
MPLTLLSFVGARRVLHALQVALGRCGFCRHWRARQRQW